MKTRIRMTIVLALIVTFLPYGILAEQQSNFNIAPSPIAYPNFASGTVDSAIEASFVSISMDDMNLKGGFVDGKGRIALNSFLAIDGELGLGGLVGSMPGIPPTPLRYILGSFYLTRVDGDAKLNFNALKMSLNLEIQPIHTNYISIILFGGGNFSYSSFVIKTPYSTAIPPPYPHAGEFVSGWVNQQTITTFQKGYQVGIQLDIPLSGTIRLSPFYMMSSFSGRATFKDDPGFIYNETTSYSYNIPTSKSYSIGMDIIFGDISIGTIFQQIKSSDQNNKKSKTIMISLGYHFGSGGSKEKEAETQKEQKREEEQIQAPSEDTQTDE